MGLCFATAAEGRNGRKEGTGRRRRINSTHEAGRMTAETQLLLRTLLTAGADIDMVQAPLSGKRRREGRSGVAV